MHKERCKADEAKGRLSETWTIGTRLTPSDVEGRACAKVHGLECAARGATAYEARCLLMPAEEAERVVKTARMAEFHAEKVEEMRMERVAEVPKRIERGELVEAKFWPVAKGRWAVVDAQTEARQFWERNVGCEAWGGKLWVDKKQVWEAGVFALEPGQGVGGLEVGSVGAAGGGWAVHATVGVRAVQREVVEIGECGLGSS